MATSTATFSGRSIDRPAQPWLRDANWDLTFVIFSVFLAALPYSIYLVFGGSALEGASQKGTQAYDARLLVNTLVALFIGGPHMYATFTRTLLNPDFEKKRVLFVASSIVIPVFVITMAVSSYESYVWLLSIFFTLASLHALQQIVWLSDAYSYKARSTMTIPRRLIDYGVVLTSLYPIAVYRMVRGDFAIGPVHLKYTDFIAGWYWLPALAALAFATFLVLFVGKTVVEYRAGALNLPKTLLISVTVLLMFWTPIFPNMDTAFQGINTWHSFQYLALTWYANHLRERRTGQQTLPTAWFARTVRGLLGRRTDKDVPPTAWSTFYLVCMAMLPVSGLFLISGSAIWPNLHANMPGSDEVYTYMGILSVLLVHYFHDAVLFTDADAIVDAT